MQKYVRFYRYQKYARLAHLVERLIDVEKAAGSNPASRTRKIWMILFYFFVLILCLIVCVLLVLFYVAQIVAAFTTDAPFVPIPQETVEKIIEHLKLTNDSVLYDLGCGDGRILKRAAEKYPSLKAVGIEIAFVPYLFAQWKTRKNKNIKIRRENIFTANVSDATHIFFYLFPEVPKKLLPILKTKCKPDTRIVSCDFEDKQSEQTEIIELNPLAKRGKKLIVYTI